MYIKDNNGTPEPYTINQLRADHPNVSFPVSYPDSVLAQFNVYPLVDEAPPAYDPDTQKVEKGPIAKIANVWTQRWRVAPLNTAELDRVNDSADSAAIRGDAAVRTLLLARPAGIENYIDNNITDLASAKEVIKILAKAISAIGKQSFR